MYYKKLGGKKSSSKYYLFFQSALQRPQESVSLRIATSAFLCNELFGILASQAFIPASPPTLSISTAALTFVLPDIVVISQPEVSLSLSATFDTAHHSLLLLVLLPQVFSFAFLEFYVGSPPT